MSNIVEIDNVMKTYDLGEGIKVKVLRGVNLKIEKGEFVTIQGPSGSGKTTLLNVIGGLDKPTSGKIIIDGTDITPLNEKELARFRREKIGFIFQAYNLVPLLTALENVELPMFFAQKLSDKEIRERAIELLKLVGLEKRMNHKPTQLSGGEQQRVAIARALANEPAIILGDEPTGNIDRAMGQKVIRLIQDLNETLNQTFIVATHDPAVAKASKRALYIVDGKVVEKPPKEYVEAPTEKLTRERRQLLLAELGWLKTSLTYLKEKKTEMDPQRYRRAFLGYKMQLERIKRIIKKYHALESEKN
ncbi:ABC transporter ATP-binding protein [Candidatus Bathyarchaeota archaeon]|nr:ABC transporter ATP-binding protein [Candidatus Bathyarchaeota archaeon]